MSNEKYQGHGIYHARQRRRWVARVAPLAFMAFLHAEFAFLLTLAPANATAQTTVGTASRSLALFVQAKNRKNDASALLVRGLFRSAADRLAPAGLARALPSGGEAAASVKRMIAFTDEGRIALNLGNWSDALTKYTAAEEIFKTVRPYAARDQAARVYKGLGVALLGMKRPDEARTALRLSLALYPSQRASEYAYNLETRNLFAQMQRELEDAPNATLAVNTKPAGAEVYVDWEFRGFAPVQVEGLSAGDHVVNTFLDGYAPASMPVAITGGPAESLELELTSESGREATEAATAVIRALERGKPGSSEALRLSRVVSATDVVVVQISSDAAGLTIMGAHFRDGTSTPIRATLLRDATFVTNTQKLLTDALGMPLPPEASLPPLDRSDSAVAVTGQGKTPLGPAVAEGEEYVVDPNSPLFRDTGKKQESKSVLTKWWFWTAVGVVVAGGATGIYLLSRRGGGGASTGDLNITINGLK